VPDLLVLLNNKDATTYAARALMAIDWSAEVAREAIQSLTKENDQVRSSITLLLRSVGTNGSAAVPTLIGFLRDRNLSRRGYVVNVLADLHVEPAVVVPALIDLLQDEDACL